MAIEKMSLVYIEGALKKVNKTLMKCCESNCFHVAVNKGGDKSGVRSLKSRSPYTSLVNRARAFAKELGIELKAVDYDDVNMNVTVDFDNYLKEVEAGLAELTEKRNAVEDALREHSVSLMQVEKLAGFEVDFSEVFSCEYIKMRFGQLPLESIPKLDYYSDRNFIYYILKDGQPQILYLVPASDAEEIDGIFASLFFERIHLPKYFKGNADAARTEMIKLVAEENDRLKAVKEETEAFRIKVEQDFLKVFSRLIAINQSYEIRQNVSAVNNKFYLSGYVPKRKLKWFISLIESLSDVRAEEKPLDSEPGADPPVLLRNNPIFRPFEMFIKMYGLPSYKGFDPTPYVAVTYMLMFGIMCGDLGQGLLISLLGIILDKWRKVKLAPIMKRIGITSAIFGFFYGSVFGNEELIEPVFKLPSIYKALGYSEAPENIFGISTILLLAAIGIGVVLLLISMMINIVTNIRKPGWLSNAVISSNGIVGMVLYASVISGIALQLGTGLAVFTLPYILCLIILPLILLFFKEPIVEFYEKLKDTGTRKDRERLLHTIKSYSDAVSGLDAINGAEEVLSELMKSRFIKAQFGVMSLDAYNKLSKDLDGSCIFYPFENDAKNVLGVFVTTVNDYPTVKKAFSGFGFKRLRMPEYTTDIKKSRNLHISDYIDDVRMEHKSVGSFIIEGVIELFESCLTYVTNTMSFLRIGGFILSHAGMMLVVSVLAGGGTGIGSFAVLALGNVFVMVMEGFLVGIQVLRLEFYEIFSRFYKGDGKPFHPIAANIAGE